jgi:glycogen debranching enzyme
MRGWADRVQYTVPSSDPTDTSFDPIRYWRGPVWVLVNWLVAEGLSTIGMTDDAESLRTETRALVERGFAEYYDPRDGTGIGGQGFSWSAALTLAWLTEG